MTHELASSATTTTAPVRTILGAGWIQPAIRLALGAPYLQSGISKSLDFAGARAEVAGFGLPAPALVALAVIATQLVGSILLLTRRWCCLGAGMLAVFTVLATLLAHAFWTFDGLNRAHQMATFFEHIAIFGGLAAAALLAQRAKRS